MLVFFKQKTAYEMRISDWSSDVCSSDLVRVGFEILKGLGIRHRGVRIVSCPSCARQGFNVIKTVEALEARLAHISTPLSLSVLGCVVNGPGEARRTRGSSRTDRKSTRLNSSH